jgi:hypothetical protein
MQFGMTVRRFSYLIKRTAVAMGKKGKEVDLCDPHFPTIPVGRRIEWIQFTLFAT